MTDREPCLSEARWYAVIARTRLEGHVAGILRAMGYEEFLPTYRRKNQWSDRTKEVELPLFTGYLFSRFDARQRLPILKIPGVIGIVGVGKTPEAVPDEDVDAIKAIIRSGLSAQPWEHLTVGSNVFIHHGPLAGLEGIALNVDKKYRLVVSVPMLQRSVAVEIERAWARPLHVSVGAASMSGRELRQTDSMF
jgi:transcription antitermination factor NusG